MPVDPLAYGMRTGRRMPSSMKVAVDVLWDPALAARIAAASGTHELRILMSPPAGCGYSWGRVIVRACAMWRGPHVGMRMSAKKEDQTRLVLTSRRAARAIAPRMLRPLKRPHLH